MIGIDRGSAIDIITEGSIYLANDGACTCIVGFTVLHSPKKIRSSGPTQSSTSGRSVDVLVPLALYLLPYLFGAKVLFSSGKELSQDRAYLHGTLTNGASSMPSTRAHIVPDVTKQQPVLGRSQNKKTKPRENPRLS